MAIVCFYPNNNRYEYQSIPIFFSQVETNADVTTVTIGDRYIFTTALLKDIPIFEILDNHELQLSRYLEGHTGIVSAILPDEERNILVSSSQDSTIMIHEISTGILKKTMRGHAGWINSIQWKGNDHVISTCDDGFVI